MEEEDEEERMWRRGREGKEAEKEGNEEENMWKRRMWRMMIKRR